MEKRKLSEISGYGGLFVMELNTEKLTSAEMGKLWVTYMGNSMSQYVLRYYLQHVEDQDIKKILVHALNLTESMYKK